MTLRTFTATLVSAQLTGLTATATSSTTINVSWNAYPGATAYQVRRNGTLIATPTGTTYTNSGHTASTLYTYAVRPVVGGVGLASAEASVNVTTLSSSWQLAAWHYETAKIPLEIVAPRAGLSTTNRYYKAYPGIEYRVPVAVLGGAWPFRYELTAAPAGMSVGETYGSVNYGVIVWPSPVAGTHTITARVTDQQGAQATVTWSLSVTTSGFLFLDAVNGNDSNAGTLASPKRTINGWYNGAKANNAYAGQFVYYRSGTYRTTDAPIEDGIRMACTGDNKPKVHMAYPGETPTLDLAGSHWSSYSNGTGNYWWSGFNVTGVGTNNYYKGFGWDSGPSDIVFFANTVQQQTTAGVGGTNPSVLFSANGGSVSERIAIIGNTFLGLNQHDLFLGYYCNKGVVEGNTISNNNGPGVYLKNNFRYWSIRNNTGISGNSNALFRIDTYGTAADIEACWNNYSTSGNGVVLGYEASPVSNIHDYRNTWRIAYNTSINVASGTWNQTRNVVVHNGSYTNGYRRESGGVTFMQTELLAQPPTTITLNADGTLSGASRTSYLGIRGHEVA